MIFLTPCYPQKDATYARCLPGTLPAIEGREAYRCIKLNGAKTPAMDLPQRWTQTAINELRVRVGSGEPVDTIAEALGRKPADILTMKDRLRLR